MISSARLAELPVFPLPNCVLMPGQTLPLHIFEARYRELVAQVLASDEVLGLGTLVPGGGIHPVLGVGRIVASKTLSDGRSNIVVAYEQRVKVVAERPQEHAFRVFETVATPDVVAPVIAVEEVRLLVGQVMRSQGGDPEELATLPGMELLHAVARQVYQVPTERLRYLEADDAERVELLRDTLLEVLVTGTPTAEA